ncbi:hypothetical protein IEQ34_005043 [Dendrobium chrysotoxum]|uniref:Uncharacterized protein n=1 Tax=Dendrobium chrysotoxum TaxID=161865 RepID=A0AAV7GST9_DENCH|nr:hypothetical protein IEQ34_005043 [Dendrobium chrysotoxum]
MGLYGKLSSDISQLFELQLLALNSNKFTGSIPPSIGLLSNLYWLDLADNQLTEPIPISSNDSRGLDLLINTKHLFAFIEIIFRLTWNLTTILTRISYQARYQIICSAYHICSSLLTRNSRPRAWLFFSLSLLSRPQTEIVCGIYLCLLSSKGHVICILNFNLTAPHDSGDERKTELF